MNRIGLSVLLASVCMTAALSVVGCSKDPPPPQQPQAYNGQYPPPQGQYPQQPGAYPQQQPGAYPQQQPGAYPQQQPGAYPQQPGPQPGQPAPGQPGQPQQPGQPGGLQFPGLPGQQPASGGGGGTAQALDPNTAGAVAAGPLGIFAASEAPGMQKDGPVVVGQFQEGQFLEGQFSFQPGKCYTLVGQGVGITTLELEMQYVTPIPGVAPSIGKATGSSTASIGGKNNCLKPISPFPANAKFIVTARKGAGVAAAQLYSK